MHEHVSSFCLFVLLFLTIAVPPYLCGVAFACVVLFFHGRICLGGPVLSIVLIFGHVLVCCFYIFN